MHTPRGDEGCHTLALAYSHCHCLVRQLWHTLGRGGQPFPSGLAKVVAGGPCVVGGGGTARTEPLGSPGMLGWYIFLVCHSLI